LSLLLSALLIPSANATPATTYTWQDRQTISVTGGDVKPNQVVTVDVNDNGPQSGSGNINTTQVIQTRSCSFWFIGCHNKDVVQDCYINMTLAFTDSGSKATITVNHPAVFSNPGSPTQCGDTASNEYNGTTVSIGGTRPSTADSTAETDAQKDVFITVNTGLKDSEAPNTIGLLITGDATQTLTAAKFAPSGNVNYTVTTKLEPGNYTVTVSTNGLDIPEQSRAFPKVKFEQAHVGFGGSEGYYSRQIQISVRMDFATGGGPTAVIGPLDVVLYDSTGKAVKTSQTDSANNVGTIQTQSASYNLTATMDGVEAGSYKICIGQGTSYCQDVVKNSGEHKDVAFNFSGAPANEIASSAASQANGGGNPADDCPLETGPMRWLGCSVFTGLHGFANSLRTQLDTYLYASPTVLFNPTSQDAANTFRNIGMVLVVVAGLIMVISQALGFEFLDAYTIRKLMPRLGIALIGMALAWPLLKFAVILTNDLGGLVYSVFMKIAGSSGAALSTTSTDAGTVAGALLGTISVTSVLVVTLGGIGILSLLGTVAIALLIGFFVLAIRQLVIFMLILLAPLAIAAYVIPGGQKLWGFWKKTLLTTLFMYPIIMGMIGAGAAMAYLIPEGSNSGTMQILAIIVYFAPYFMLPMAFKMAGGLMSTIFSIANDKNRGMFDRLKKQRQGIREGRMVRAKNNSLWSHDSRLQKALGANKWASVLTDPGGNLAHAGRNIPGFRKKGSSIEASINSQRTQQTGKLFEELNNMFGNNDKAYRLLSGAHQEGFGKVDKVGTTAYKLKQAGLYGKRITSLNDLQAASKILSESEEGSERLAGNAIHNASGRLATLNQDPEMLRADVTAAGMMGLAAHGFASSEDIAHTGNILKQSGMSAGAAQSMVVQAQLLGARGRPDVKAGYGIVYNGKTGEFESGINAEGSQNRAEALIKSLSSSDLAGAKTGGFLALEPHIREMVMKGGDSGLAVQEQLFSWAGQYSQASADTKAESLRFIRENGLTEPFDRYNRAYDPERAGAGAPVAEPPADKSQGGGK
jgi:hypothetical protein